MKQLLDILLTFFKQVTCTHVWKDDYHEHLYFRGADHEKMGHCRRYIGVHQVCIKCEKETVIECSVLMTDEEAEELKKQLLEEEENAREETRSKEAETRNEQDTAGKVS